MPCPVFLWRLEKSYWIMGKLLSRWLLPGQPRSIHIDTDLKQSGNWCVCVCVLHSNTSECTRETHQRTRNWWRGVKSAYSFYIPLMHESLSFDLFSIRCHGDVVTLQSLERSLGLGIVRRYQWYLVRAECINGYLIRLMISNSLIFTLHWWRHCIHAMPWFFP